MPCNAPFSASHSSGADGPQRRLCGGSWLWWSVGRRSPGATLSMTMGLLIGLISGYLRRIDAVVMRVMDGMMAIPAIVLAVALMALVNASVQNVIIALTIPEVPRVVRLVRALVLSLREQPFVEASRATGASLWRLLLRHIAPNTLAPLIVQGTYICASAVIFEA